MSKTQKKKCSMPVQPGMSSNILDRPLDFWYLSYLILVTCHGHGTCSNGQIGKYGKLIFPDLNLGYTSETKENARWNKSWPVPSKCEIFLCPGDSLFRIVIILTCQNSYHSQFPIYRSSVYSNYIGLAPCTGMTNMARIVCHLK